MKRIIITTVFAMGLVLIGVDSMAAQSSSVDGRWTLDYPYLGPPYWVKFEVKGETLEVRFDRECIAAQVTPKGTIKGNDITFSCTFQLDEHPTPYDLTYTFKGKVNGDSMSGKVSVTNESGDIQEKKGPQEWTAKRDKPKP